MPDRALLKRNAELSAALTRLRAEVALTQETLQAARLCSESTVELIARMRDALEDIHRRTAPEGVLAQAILEDPCCDEVAELHQIADAALRGARRTQDDVARA